MVKGWIFSWIVIGALLNGCTSTAVMEKNTATVQAQASFTPAGTNSTATLTIPTYTLMPSIMAATPTPTTVLIPTLQKESTQPGMNGLIRSEVYLEQVEVSMSGNNPVQPMIRLKGSLPTPCNKLQVDIGKPDPKNQIQVDVYSLIDPNQICAQVIVPFTQNVPLKDLSKGKYTVWVNGIQAGDINVP